MNFIVWIIIGAIAGFIAARVTKSAHGLLTNIVVGIIGSLLGGSLARLLNLNVTNAFIDQLIVATIGAIILVFAWKAIRKA